MEVVPGVVVGVVSHAPIRSACRGAGGHDRGIRGPGCSVRSSSAAGPAHAQMRARPGLWWSSRSVARPGAGWACALGGRRSGRSLRGEQVVGAGEQLGAIAVVAIFILRAVGDRLKRAGEVRRPLGGLHRLAQDPAQPSKPCLETCPCRTVRSEARTVGVSPARAASRTSGRRAGAARATRGSRHRTAAGSRR